MNQRIRELLKKATRQVNREDREWVFSEVDQEKFARLIVKECIEAVYDDGQDAEYYQDRIKQHFGVKY